MLTTITQERAWDLVIKLTLKSDQTLNSYKNSWMQCPFRQRIIIHN